MDAHRYPVALRDSGLHLWGSSWTGKRNLTVGPLLSHVAAIRPWSLPVLIWRVRLMLDYYTQCIVDNSRRLIDPGFLVPVLSQ